MEKSIATKLLLINIIQINLGELISCTLSNLHRQNMYEQKHM